jgi:hypothetical protein
MSSIRTFLGVGGLAAGVLLVASAPASAANSPAFRDCSLVAGLDPDFVRLSEVTVGAEGLLTVPAGQKQVGVEASESSDPGDSLGHVTLKVTVASPGLATQTVAGEGTGKVLLSAPLRRSKKKGRTYTIEWAATFDNGNHVCPSESTPENTRPDPFIVAVA